MMNPFDAKYELQTVTGNVDRITKDSFILATEQKESFELQATEQFNVSPSQCITAVWIQVRESSIEPKLIFLYNHHTNIKQYTLPSELQKHPFKLSNQLIIQFCVNLLASCLLLALISLVTFFLVPSTLYNKCANLVISIIQKFLLLLVAFILVFIFVRKSIKIYQKSNEGYFWITQTLDSFIGINEPNKNQDLQKFQSQAINRYWGLIQWSLGFAKKSLKPVELPNQLIITNSPIAAFTFALSYLGVIAAQFAIALFPLILILSPLWLPIYGITKLPDIVKSFSVCFPR